MFNLLNPKMLWLAAIPLGIVLALILIPRRSRARVLLKMTPPWEALRREFKKGRIRMRVLFALFVTGLLFLVWAMARPVERLTSVKKDSPGIDIVMVFDISESMDATDFEPTRFVAAKQVVTNFVKRRAEDRIGLVIFSGDSVTKVPLTRDHDFIFDQIDELKLREMKQGTAIGMGLASGITRLRSSSSRTRIIVLLTDGDSNVGYINPITAAHLARQEGIRIYTIGIGKSDRVLVPIYAYDAYGRRTQLVAQIPSYLNPELLKQVAQITGGKSFMARDAGALNNILMEVDKLERSTMKLQAQHKLREAFWVPALCGTLLLFIVFLLLETRFRRGSLGYSV